MSKLNLLVFATACIAASCSSELMASSTTPCPVEFIILGTSQDAGTPQIGNSSDPAWSNLDGRRSCGFCRAH